MLNLWANQTFMPYIILTVYLVIAITLQILTGDFPVYIMAFPLNLILAALWLITVSALWKGFRKSMFVGFMLSRTATVSSITLFLLFTLVVGFTGKDSLISSWVYVALLLYLQTVILFVILRGWRAPTATGARLGAVRWRFLMLHAGLLVALFSSFWGAPDMQTLRLKAVSGVPVNEAYRTDGMREHLSYDVILDDFRTETYENGVPSMYDASVVIGGDTVSLRVNRPYRMDIAQDVYLVSAGKDGKSCVIQIVRDPWKYGTVAGILLMLAGAFLLFAGGPRRRYGEDD